MSVSGTFGSEPVIAGFPEYGAAYAAACPESGIRGIDDSVCFKICDADAVNMYAAHKDLLSSDNNVSEYWRNGSGFIRMQFRDQKIITDKTHRAVCFFFK
jgi:hypothetical protein